MIQDLLKALMERLGAGRTETDPIKLQHPSHAAPTLALKVLLLQEGDHWIAQGLDVDYAAAGDSLEDVKRRFSEGLCRTIERYLDTSVSLEGLLRPAPPEIWQLFYRMERSLETSMEELDLGASHTEASPSLSRLAFLRAA